MEQINFNLKKGFLLTIGRFRLLIGIEPKNTIKDVKQNENHTKRHTCATLL